ncbi:MAG: DUF1810 domain-containing protein [Novosphingobium sp.]|nr:DUF1810 domain-containing protein [Novosphingobium sp.]
MSLERFRTALDETGTWARALAELKAGRKRTHWMWFVFPQLAGLGTSPTAQLYAIRDLAEAREYLADPVLRDKLLQATAATAEWSGLRGLEAIFGGLDALKFVSSMTLFEQAAEGADRGIFADALDGLGGGKRDARTLALLRAASPS